MAEKRLVAPAHLAAANAIEFGIPLIDVTAFDPAHNAVKLVSEELIQKHQVLPLFKRGGKLFVGTSNPTQTGKSGPDRDPVPHPPGGGARAGR